MPIHKQKPEYTGSKSLDEIICYLEGRDIKSFTRNGRTLTITLFNGMSYNVTLPEGGGGGKCCYMAGDGINITEDNEIETNAELSKTTEAISVKGDIGSYSDGDIIDAGTSVEEILMKLLKKVVDVDTVLPTATIAINASDNGEKHLFNISQGVSLTMNNISIKGFNTAICNQGSCQFTNVTFEENRAKDKLGGAITNNARLNCVNCSFIKNSAKSGGAIYNEQGSQSTLLYCIFKDNEASKSSKSDLIIMMRKIFIHPLEHPV